MHGPIGSTLSMVDPQLVGYVQDYAVGLPPTQLAPTILQPTLAAVPAETPALLRARQRTFETIQTLQSNVLESASDALLVQRYSTLLLDLAGKALRAPTETDAALVSMRVEQLRAAWNQVSFNLGRRKNASILAGLLFLALIAALISSGHLARLMTGEFIDLNSYVIPVLRIPAYVVVWSALGSVTAVLYRVNRTNIGLEDPFSLLMTQPILGVVMGTVSYLVIQLGLVTLTTASTSVTEASVPFAGPSERTVFFFSLVAFIIGFSDRLADSVLRSLASRLGGGASGELVTGQAPGAIVRPTSMQAIVDALQHKQLEATVIEGNGDQKKSTISETVTEVHASPPPGASPRRRVRKSRAADLEPAPAPGPPTPDGPAALPGT